MNIFFKSNMLEYLKYHAKAMKMLPRQYYDITNQLSELRLYIDVWQNPVQSNSGKWR